MWRSFQFPVILAFFLVMNVLLWRSEFAGHSDVGSPIPAELVWHRILTAPDDSALEITRGEEKIGYCRWIPNVGEARQTGRTLPENYEPDVLLQSLGGYTIDLEGNVLIENARVRFAFNLECGTNHTWRELTLNLTLRPQRLEIHASAAERSVRIKVSGGDVDLNRTFRFEELADPTQLAGAFDNPMLPLVLGAIGPAFSHLPRDGAPSAALSWQASTDWLAIGRSRMRVNRMEARFFDRYKFVVVTSRVGEILRVELPGNIRLLNDALLLL